MSRPYPAYKESAYATGTGKHLILLHEYTEQWLRALVDCRWGWCHVSKTTAKIPPPHTCGARFTF